MKIRLNPEAVEQLTSIMDRMGYTSPTHVMQVMISSTYNKLIKNANKHTSPIREDKHGNQSSKRM
ncbi:hypothetical protein PS645_01474 [Pseudomonas fluorescens]|uniref:Uncharacterized protein n=1 Tax=Pseudomonas fluorescens TaxID=294 RepID=A0A5E6R9D2_PSEFL|nr:hypothetical protein PS645_01474 [Pseudomonas fluorescens]